MSKVHLFGLNSFDLISFDSYKSGHFLKYWTCTVIRNKCYSFIKDLLKKQNPSYITDEPPLSSQTSGPIHSPLCNLANLFLTTK